MTRWNTVRLGKVAEIDRNTIDASDIREGTTYVGLEHIDSDGNFVAVGDVAAGQLASSKFAFTEQHVLYGKLRPYLAKIARPGFQGVCSTDILPLLPGPDLSRDYLAHFLRQPRMVDLATSRSAGANLPRLSPRVLADFQIPLPPLPEQRRIAAILDKADDLRAKRRAALAQLDGLAQSVFVEMFGDVLDNTHNLPTAPLSEVCPRVTDGTHQPPDWEEGGIPFLFVSNIVNGEIVLETEKFISRDTYTELTRRCPIELGDVLYTTVGSYGNAAEVKTTKRFAFQRHIAHIKPDKSRLVPSFLSSMLGSGGVRRQADRVARGVAQKTVNLAQLKGFRLVVPPLNAQSEFARRKNQAELIRDHAASALRELDALFASLQHRAFRGEL